MSAHQRRRAATRALIVATLLAIGVMLAARTARHPLRWARYLATRVLRRIPGRRDDGEPLSDGEMRAFIGICRGWEHAAEGSRT